LKNIFGKKMISAKNIFLAFGSNGKVAEIQQSQAAAENKL
jgi:hypothetical protein